ncbi:hypothetical protein [Sinorhizobium meliloti]|uniref:hypothetical protein n=1 Tax=Rhizobium meliloti TaxID=382 RepID=UPI0014169969|nr:hypothetical protein [Sinorhizobium meliloti]MQX28980.1 hypothetical protein [Sinorhizobium meliloti]
MTSLLSPMRLGVFDLPKLSAHFPGHILFDVQADNEHGLGLPVSILGESSKANADQIAILCNLSDEVRIRVRRTEIHDEDWVLRSAALADDGAHRKLAGSMQ